MRVDARLLLVVVPALLVLAGLVMVGSGVRAIVVARRFLGVAQQVRGTVSDHRYQVLRRGQSRRRRVVTIPVLRFTTRAGQLVEAQQAVALRSGAPERGAQVGVLYDPADPARAAMVGSTSGITTESVVRIVFGTVFALFAASFVLPWVVLPIG